MTRAGKTVSTILGADDSSGTRGSAIYTGMIRHRRMQPAAHAFDYRVCMLYLDLAELPQVFDGSWLFSARRRALAEFRRADHLGDTAVPLDQAVRELVEERCGRRPVGPIRLLTHLRYFGYVFNPVSFYYCFDSSGAEVEFIVAEVNNTPWGERHCYVLEAGQPGPGSAAAQRRQLRFQPAKAMHVSPFMPMDTAYDWRFAAPGKCLSVHMANLQDGKKMFDATLSMQHRAITPAALAWVLISYPLMTLKIMAAIHWQALRLWLKKCPVYDHPDKHASASLTGEGSI